MNRRRNPEADLQRAVVRFLRLVLPAGSLVHHSAHEQRGSDVAARRRQAIAQGLGVCAGFPDLIVLSCGRVLFLELKSPRGRLSPAQKHLRALIEAQGHGYAVVRSLDDARAALGEAGITLRGNMTGEST